MLSALDLHIKIQSLWSVFWNYRISINFVQTSLMQDDRKTNQPNLREIRIKKLRGANKSLVLPGRKQANVSVRMAWISFGALPCRKKKILMTARVSMLLKSRASLTCFRARFLPGRTKDLSAPQYFNLFNIFLEIALKNIQCIPYPHNLTEQRDQKICNHSYYLCQEHGLLNEIQLIYLARYSWRNSDIWSTVRFVYSVQG